MKRLTALLIGLTFSVCSFANTPIPHPQSSAVVLDRVAAVVNDDIITEKELDSAVKQTRRMAEKHKVNLPAPKALRKMILNQLINQQLILQLGKRQGITISDKELDQRIQLIQKTKHWTKAQLLQDVKSAGLTEKSFRTSIRNELIADRVKQQVLSSRVQPDEKKVDAIYTTYQNDPKYAVQYHLIDILIAVPASASKSERALKYKEALKIEKQLERGASFDYLADGDDTDLGWRTAAQIPEIFSGHLKSMKVEGVAGPIRADNGFHVIRLEGIRPGKGKMPSKEQIQHIVRMQSVQKALQDWIRELRAQAYIKVESY